MERRKQEAELTGHVMDSEQGVYLATAESQIRFDYLIAHYHVASSQIILHSELQVCTRWRSS